MSFKLSFIPLSILLFIGAIQGQNDIGRQMVDQMNAARAKAGLPKIPYSAKLSKVAQAHCDNMAQYSPQTTEIHDWFGPLACSFNGNPNCMWSKARQVGGYNGDGYEISLKGDNDPASMIRGWLGSPAHSDVILSKGMWGNQPWMAVGGGAKGGFATMWFGHEKDDSTPEDSTNLNSDKNQTQQSTNDSQPPENSKPIEKQPKQPSQPQFQPQPQPQEPPPQQQQQQRPPTNQPNFPQFPNSPNSNWQPIPQLPNSGKNNNWQRIPNIQWQTIPNMSNSNDKNSWQTLSPPNMGASSNENYNGINFQSFPMGSQLGWRSF